MADGYSDASTAQLPDKPFGFQEGFSSWMLSLYHTNLNGHPSGIRRRLGGTYRLRYFVHCQLVTLMLSSLPTYYYSTTTSQMTTSASITKRLAICLRHVGNLQIIVNINAIWIIISCVFHFYDR